MPDFKLPDIDLEKAAAGVNEAVKDAAYAAVGFGILGFQRAQVHRVEITKQFGDLAKSVDEALSPVRHQIDEHLDEIESVLPSPADGLLHSLRESAGAGERAIRTAVGLS